MPTAIIPGVLGLIQAGVGAANKAKTQEEADLLANTRPELEISPETTNELKLSESELQQGMGARAERAYTMLAEKGLANSLSAILRGGGNLNSVGDLYGQGEEGRLRLTQLQESTRLNQIQNLINSRRNSVNEQQKVFQFNKWMPWADASQANAQSRQGADAQIWGGLQTIGSTAMNFAQNQHEEKMFDKYFSYNDNTPTTNNTTGYMPNNIPASQYRAIPPENGLINNNNIYGGRDYYQYSDNPTNYNQFG